MFKKTRTWSPESNSNESEEVSDLIAELKQFQQTAEEIVEVAKQNKALFSLLLFTGTQGFKSRYPDNDQQRSLIVALTLKELFKINFLTKVKKFVFLILEITLDSLQKILDFLKENL